MSVDLGRLEAPRTERHALRHEVERRAAGLRRRRGVRRLEAGAAAVVLTLVAVLVATTHDGAPSRVRTVDPATERPAEPGRGGPITNAENRARSTVPPKPRASELSPRAPEQRPPGAVREAGGPRARLLVRTNDGLLEVDPDGANPVLLREGWTTQVAWSPDSRTLALTDGDSIRLLDAATGAETAVFEGAADVKGTPPVVAVSPAWSPDGTTILFVRSPSVVLSASVWKTDLATRTTTRLELPRSNPADAPDPKMRHDGRILYRCDDQGPLCLSNVEGHDLGAVPGTSLVDGFDWSPDGEWIAVTSVDEGLAVVRPDGTDRRVIVSGRATGTPRWMPDGSGIFFGVAGSVYGAVPHFVRIDGSGLRALGPAPGPVVSVRFV